MASGIQPDAGQILNSLINSVLVVDDALAIHYANPAAQQLLAQSSRKLFGTPLPELLSYFSLNIDLMRESLAAGQGFTDNEVTLVIDSRSHILSLTAQRLPDDFILLEMAPMDNQRRLSQEQLQHAQQIAARDLVRGLAHEIKNPLGGLRGAAHRPVFVWPTREQRWSWLSTATLKVAPGSQAAYSNLAFDLLADALATASGKPYTQLFEEKITRPLGMKDTTFTPSPDQCKRLMVAEKGASPCNNTLAAIGSGGVYSTPGDMMRWMQQYLSSDFYHRSHQADRMQTLIYQRTQLKKIIGMDVPGKADALGLGWVYMAPKDGRPGIIQKTGGGGGFITYMAMIPQYNIGAFVVVTRSPLTRFTNMSDGINDLVTELSGNKPIAIPAS